MGSVGARCWAVPRLVVVASDGVGWGLKSSRVRIVDEPDKRAQDSVYHVHQHDRWTVTEPGGPHETCGDEGKV